MKGLKKLILVIMILLFGFDGSAVNSGNVNFYEYNEGITPSKKEKKSKKKNRKIGLKIIVFLLQVLDVGLILGGLFFILYSFISFFNVGCFFVGIGGVIISLALLFLLFFLKLEVYDIPLS